MAGNEDRKAELIARLARARQQLDSSGRNVRRAMDVPARIRSSLRSHPAIWLGGGLLAGVVISQLLRRPRTRTTSAGKEKSRKGALPKAGAAGLLVAGGKIAFDILRPLLVKWLVRRAAPLAENLMARYTSHSEAPDREGH
jgi:hypothetical protein